MPDREKVIKGLECHAKGAKGCLFDCPYGNENGCQLLLCSDALALLKKQDEIIKELQNAYGYLQDQFFDTQDKLLKEQEAIEPRVSTAEQRCGHCNKVIEMDGWQSCPWCGKRIDWEGR